jgi:HAD superfamily hydrolase (TIGR01509 family)
VTDSTSVALLFDFGGTLDADGVPWSPRFHHAYRAAGGTLDFGAFDPLFAASDRALAREPGIRTAGFRAAIETQARLLVDLIPSTAGAVDPQDIAARLHAQALATVRQNRPVLERLARAHRLGVVSNFSGNLAPCLAELDLLQFFTVTADSTLVGATKPDARIFQYALTGLSCSADRAWMIGDNPDADIGGAARLGLKTCWVAPAERALPPGCTPTARIARLRDLERALAGA